MADLAEVLLFILEDLDGRSYPFAGAVRQGALSGAFTCLVEESDYQEEWIIEYDARRDLMVNLTTGEVYDPPWPRRPMGFSPY